jgi:hypothetical protein
VLEAAGEVGQGPAAVRETHLQLGKLIEHAAEDEVSCGHRGVEWVTERVPEIERRQPFRPVDDVDRVKQEREPERLALLQHREERRIGEVPVGDVGSGVDGADPG